MSWLEIWAMMQVIGMVIPIVVILIVMLVVIGSEVRQAIKRARCTHIYYHETQACDAVCNHCGKNLGFIGNVREHREKKETR